MNTTRQISSLLTDPYCVKCGYQLKGLVDSSKCPECGTPFTEGLVRAANYRSRRYTSKQTLGPWPLLSIALGPAPGERVGQPRGIIAIGDFPVGFLAIGGIARGVIAIGGCAFGVFSLGACSVGALLALGAFSMGFVAVGSLALGGITVGALSLCFLKGWGAHVIHLL